MKQSWLGYPAGVLGLPDNKALKADICILFLGCILHVTVFLDTFFFSRPWLCCSQILSL